MANLHETIGSAASPSSRHARSFAPLCRLGMVLALAAPLVGGCTDAEMLYQAATLGKSLDATIESGQKGTLFGVRDVQRDEDVYSVSTDLYDGFANSGKLVGRCLMEGDTVVARALDEERRSVAILGLSLLGKGIWKFSLEAEVPMEYWQSVPSTKRAFAGQPHPSGKGDWPSRRAAIPKSAAVGEAGKGDLGAYVLGLAQYMGISSRLRAERLLAMMDDAFWKELWERGHVVRQDEVPSHPVTDTVEAEHHFASAKYTVELQKTGDRRILLQLTELGDRFYPVHPAFRAKNN